DATPIWPSELLWMDLAYQAEMPVDLRNETPATYANADQGLQKAVAGLRSVAWEQIPRTGDAGHAVMPDWSHDGVNIVYTSTDAPQYGRIGTATEVDIFTVPFANGAGGDATGIPGASTAENFEYYPDFSPDDSLVAFNRVASYDTGTDKKDAYDHVYYRP